MPSEFSSCTRLPFIPKLTLQHSSGQIWTVLTFDSNKNVLNVILLSWNLTHKHTKMKIFKTFSLGAIKVWGCTESNLRVSDPPVWVKSNKMKLVLLGNYKIEKLYLTYMPVCNFFLGQWWQRSRGNLTLSRELSVFLPHLPRFPQTQAPAGFWRIMGESWKSKTAQERWCVVHKKSRSLTEVNLLY